MIIVNIYITLTSGTILSIFPLIIIKMLENIFHCYPHFSSWEKEGAEKLTN